MKRFLHILAPRLAARLAGAGARPVKQAVKRAPRRPSGVAPYVVAAACWVGLAPAADAEADADADAMVTSPAAVLPVGLDYVITAPTAIVPAAPSLGGMIRYNHRGQPTVQGSLGLGGIGLLIVGMDHDFRQCTTCDGADSKHARAFKAEFRLGTQLRWGRTLAPHVAFGVRVAKLSDLAADASDQPTAQQGKHVDTYLAASQRVGPLLLHIGLVGQNASVRLSDDSLGEQVLRANGLAIRPFAGVEWTPAPFPKTRMLLDATWQTQLDRQAATPRLAQRWVVDWGVRYWVNRRVAAELAVSHRQSEGLSASTVLIAGRAQLGW